MASCHSCFLGSTQYSIQCRFFLLASMNPELPVIVMYLLQTKVTVLLLIHCTALCGKHPSQPCLSKALDLAPHIQPECKDPIVIFISYFIFKIVLKIYLTVSTTSTYALLGVSILLLCSLSYQIVTQFLNAIHKFIHVIDLLTVTCGANT